MDGESDGATDSAAQTLLHKVNFQLVVQHDCAIATHNFIVGCNLPD